MTPSWKADVENWILITNDRDFGMQVYPDRRTHHGVVFLRLKDERATAKIATLSRLLATFSDRLADSFVVVSASQVRFAKR
jgi:hypothetical protein